LSHRSARLHSTQPGGIGSLESILSLLKSIKIQAHCCPSGYIGWRNRFLGSINVYKFVLCAVKGRVMVSLCAALLPLSCSTSQVTLIYFSRRSQSFTFYIYKKRVSHVSKGEMSRGMLLRVVYYHRKRPSCMK
jgi:hypothetical protein